MKRPRHGHITLDAVRCEVLRAPHLSRSSFAGHARYDVDRITRANDQLAPERTVQFSKTAEQKVQAGRSSDFREMRIPDEERNNRVVRA